MSSLISTKTTTQRRATPATPARIPTTPAIALFLFAAPAYGAIVLAGAGADAVVAWI